MADPVTQAKKDLHHATDERQNRIQNWWNQQINRAARSKNHVPNSSPGSSKPSAKTSRRRLSSAPFSPARDDPPKRPRGRPRKPINEPSAGREKSLKNA
jgi:hypothetical protein